MSAIHILTGTSDGTYTVAVHVATPAGNNAAGVPWPDAIKNSGRAISSMTVGAGPGQITQAELTQIQAGTLIEATLQWQDDPTKTVAQRLAAIDAAATQLSNDTLTKYAAELKLFGLTRG